MGYTRNEYERAGARFFRLIDRANKSKWDNSRLYNHLYSATKRMTKAGKLEAWGDRLENENYHEVAGLARARLAELYE